MVRGTFVADTCSCIRMMCSPIIYAIGCLTPQITHFAVSVPWGPDMPIVGKVPYGKKRGMGETLCDHKKWPPAISEVCVALVRSNRVGIFTLPTLSFLSSTFILPSPNMFAIEFSHSTASNLFTLVKIF